MKEEKPKEGMTCDRCKKVAPALCFTHGKQLCIACLDKK